MYKIFLYGEIAVNNGPANVNKNLISSADKRLLYPQFDNKYLKLIESIFKILVCDILILSGVGTVPTFLCNLAKKMKKPVVYLMHGCIEYEAAINKIKNAEFMIESEAYTLKECDLILGVSEQYGEWVKQRYPQYMNKIGYLNNGVDFKIREKKVKIRNSIAVAGGNRNIKNNNLVCEAIQKLNVYSEQKYKLYVFGLVNDDNDDNDDCFSEQDVEFMGQLDTDEYLDKLDQMELFVINSEVESFGLALADAINCNCALLISRNTGAKSLVETTDKDIIYDCHNVDEIADKIEYLMKHSNAKRIAKSINVEACSKKKAYEKLLEICDNLLARQKGI